MIYTRRVLTFCLFLSLCKARSFGQQLPVTRPKPAVSADSLNRASYFRKLLEQTDARALPTGGLPVPGKPATIPHTVLSTVAPRPGQAAATTLSTPSCIDTTTHILTSENGVLGVDYITRTRDGDVLAPGFRYTITPPYYTSPYLVKYTPQGSILWAKSFDGLGIYPQNSATAYKCFELNDGSLLMMGGVSIPEPVNGRTELAMWKLDANGNLLWTQTDSCSIWTQYSGSLDVIDLVQDAADNIYLAGNQRAWDALTTHSFALKMDALGNIKWDKSFTSRQSSCFGLMWTGAELSMVGSNLSSSNLNYLWCLRIDPATGDTVRSRAWTADFGPNSSWYNITAAGKASMLSNGNIAIYGPVLADVGQVLTPQVHGAVAEFDPSFKFLRGWMIRSNMPSNYYNTVITEHPTGRISYTYITYVGNYDEDILYGAIEQGQIIKERSIDLRNRSSAWTSNFIFTPGNQDIVLQYFGDPLTNTSGQEFIRLHDSDTSSACSGNDTTASWLEPYAMQPVTYYYWDGIASNSFRKTNRIMPPPVDGNPVQQTACKLASFCDNIQLSVDQDVVCAGAPAVFTCKRNPECGARPLWVFDTTNIQSYKLLNDTTLQLIYRDNFKGTVSAKMTGTCSTLSEGKLLTVLPADKTVTLGADSWLCPDSALVLRPAKGFSSYLWQDGSVADTLLVTSPGTYSVVVTNTCGVPSSDEVVVQQAPSLNFNVGPDLAICLNDPMTLHAPDGYDHYSWQDLDNGHTYQSQDLTVSPVQNTRYFAEAQTPQGCVVKATVAVRVDHPLPIGLGNDVSLCIGDSILLNAGSGFLNYQWNNGATGNAIFAHSQGMYTVKAQSPNGCFSMDTLEVLRLYPAPELSLDNSNWLCEGTTRTLQAGSSYNNYQWQDGSTAPSLQVSATGTYWVRVTDINGCIGRDTVIISHIIQNPIGFLVPDTVICNGYPSKIAAKGQFSTYAWSSGETESYITVRRQGRYSLFVTDYNGCTATENIAITTKQCLFGIHFFDAFSPNGDGANDLFRPYVLGDMAHYQMQIFDRWGQLVFTTKDYTAGWDGRVKYAPQPAGAYVWICSYQFAGEKEKVETGTLLLVR